MTRPYLFSIIELIMDGLCCLQNYLYNIWTQIKTTILIIIICWSEFIKNSFTETNLIQIINNRRDLPIAGHF